MRELDAVSPNRDVVEDDVMDAPPSEPDGLAVSDLLAPPVGGKENEWFRRPCPWRRVLYRRSRWAK